MDDLPEVYHSDKGIDPEDIDAYEIETSVNIVPESESEYDDIDEEQEKWVRYAQVGIDCLGAEDGYYNTHSYDDKDYVPTVEDLERCNEFENIDAELDDIYNKEEDDKAKTLLTIGFKELEVRIQWATVYEAREHMRRFKILNHFTYIYIYNDGHTMVLRHGNFQYSCEGKLGADNTLCNVPWVAREVEALIRDVRAMTPKAIKIRIKIQYGVEISYWTAWNA
ncbi:hypothetical protein GIB67_011135 [Kingdonia uniflora]|uniref:Uncharacterized protein n=1 Tax=Kingdonia uniflora TaxID=39325 RepID=A0A7J7PAA9_9MAGN|nr:hypothetical protein GIB67_011135 [Kingdonia uniflora]